jgi:hypothetical protein
MTEEQVKEFKKKLEIQKQIGIIQDKTGIEFNLP